MRIYGLTGNTGTGKTTVAERLKQKGVAVVDADQLARRVVEPGTEAIAEIEETFGTEYIDETGHLRRQALGRLVFQDPSARRKLEAITHPRVARLTQQRFQQLEEQGHQVAVYDAPLVVETNMVAMFEGLIVVIVGRAAQLHRIMKRDGLSREDAMQRIDAQMPIEDKAKLADFVIDNTGPESLLDGQIDALMRWLDERSPL